MKNPATKVCQLVTPHIIWRIRAGLPIIIADAKDRENEGDLFFAASKITIAMMAFMIRWTSGIVCAPMTRERAHVLHLRLLIHRPTSHYGCKFLTPVDVKSGTSTGISAHDRVLTLRRLADSKARSGDFGRPGHIFPLLADRKLLKGRQGHTEAAIALLEAARMPRVGVIAELINDNGTMMRGSRLPKFAKDQRIPIITIDDIAKTRV